ncbi:RutC family protein [Candidatus Gugararchaeum adminiculabundum]|nr:RutC family protein [Candidatus Gugararchaeum adminiculabundum]
MAKTISTDKAPKAFGPYSQAVKSDSKSFIFCSGQLGTTPAGEMVSGGIREQAKQALANLKAVLEASGSSLEKVVKTTVYLKDMNDFAAMNEEYAKFFASNKPARATVQVARLPKDGLVEIDCIAEA